MINSLSTLLYCPAPNAPVSWQNWANQHQWPIVPGMNRSQSAFAVEAARLRGTYFSGASATITDQNKAGFQSMTNSIAGQADGWHYAWDGGVLDIPGIPPDISLGALSGPTGVGGDSSGIAAPYLWLPGPASIPLNSFVKQAEYAMAQMAASNEFSVTNFPLKSYVIDARHELLKWWNTGTPPSWFSRLPYVLGQYANTGVPLWLITPPWTNNTAHTEFVNYFVAALGDGFTVVCEDAHLCDSAPHKINLLSATEATAAQTKMTIESAEWDGRHVCLDAGRDTLLVLKHLVGIV